LTATKFPSLHIPKILFIFAKFFGSGVIIATAFIHLLASSFAELGNGCLSTFWDVSYPWSAAFSMISVFSLFFVELFAMRFAGVAFATTGSTGVEDDALATATVPTVHGGSSVANENDSAVTASTNYGRKLGDTETGENSVPTPLATGMKGQKLDARLLGFFILEFGVIFHSVIIGLTLSTTGADFNTLFIVIIFHQMFEGLGLGSRLAILPFRKGSVLPWLLGTAYGLVTPLGMAIGLGVRTTYDSASQTALLVSGILDAISSGILLYTGLVELLAHEFLFSGGS
jgi:solute carrier family 39 (zinc transporter), member 1/2/3